MGKKSFDKGKVSQQANLLTTERARHAFFSALENPRGPNEALKAAFKKHSKLVDK